MSDSDARYGEANTPFFSDKELAFLKALTDHGVAFIIVGLSAAALQGAPVVTQDVDLWFQDLSDKNLQAALKKVGATYIPSFQLHPPMFAGKGLSLFDIVLTIKGLGDFEEVTQHTLTIDLGPCTVKILSLEQVITSKEAANREKDKLVLPVLKNALLALKKKQKS